MRFRLILIFLLVLKLNMYAQDSTRFYKTIDTLCTEYFYGRGYENDGHLKTAKYLHDKFKKSDTVFSQPFSFNLNKFTDELLILGSDTLFPCHDYLPLPQSGGVLNGTFKTVQLDSSFFSDKKRIKKFLKKDIKGYAVIYDTGLEAKITDNLNLRKKIYLESGVIIQLTNNELLKSFSQKSWMPPSFSVKKSLWKNQKTIFVNLNQKEIHINSNNVIAVLNGTDTTLKELIISAHYDHVGGYESCFIPGANDNASGVAMMLELFHYFRVNRPKRTIRFIAFGAEEVGLLGSSFYVNNMDKAKVEFVLNLDLYGAGSKGVTVVNGTIFTSFMEKLEKLNEQKLYVSKVKKRGEAANSDHYYFSKNGIPAFFIYSNGTVGGYHNIKDVPKDLEKGNVKKMFLLLRDFSLSI